MKSIKIKKLVFNIGFKNQKKILIKMIKMLHIKYRNLVKMLI